METEERGTEAGRMQAETPGTGGTEAKVTDTGGIQAKEFETGGTEAKGTETEAAAESLPRSNFRQRRKSSGRVRFSEEHLSFLKAESMKDRARREEVAAAAAAAAENEGLGWGVAFVVLALARYFSARSNLFHDCDEVFNYWEPLHNLLYKSGFQTWEYSSEFALRSWLYILFHAVIVKPASWWYGTGPGKVHVLHLLRFLLGLCSASTEAALVAGVGSVFGKRLSAYTLLLLCFTSGLFIASTSFLPSTFSMYMITLAAAALLFRKPCIAVAVAAVGVLIGWPFSGLAVLPLVACAFAIGDFSPVFFAGVTTSIITLVMSIGIDKFFYGRWTSSVLNLITYNTFGGNSGIFGVEGPLFYLRNGFNNFNLVVPLALLFPLLFVFNRKRYGLLVVIVSPVYLWTGFMSLQSHKEERFLYPVYPLICLAAAAMIEAIPDLVPRPRFRAPNEEPGIVTFAKLLRPITLAAVLALSYSRMVSLLSGYSAPMQAYSQLPQLKGDILSTNQVSTVCVGSEWHRFPSSFFLPSPHYQVGWLDDGEKVLLPLPFNRTLGGTAAAPPYFNKNNRAAPKQFLKNEDICSFLIELKLKRPGRLYRGDESAKWQLLWEQPFLDNEVSPPFYRAIFIPWLWGQKNSFATYRLLQRRDLEAE